MRSTVLLASIQFLLVVYAESRPDDYDTESSEHRAVCVGCPSKGDEYDPIYYNLAQETLTQYLSDNALDIYHKISKINTVTKQVVSGILTKINFDASPTNCKLGSDLVPDYCDVSDISKYINCDSEIWERSWLKKKDINITCKEKQRVKRQIFGGVTEEDPNDPAYLYLAIESLNKYADEQGFTGSRDVVEVTKATTQVVEGFSTRIQFHALLGASQPVTCSSSILEQPWKNVRDIKVTCTKPQAKVSSPGGETEKDVNDPIYRDLAEESLQKYVLESGLRQPYVVTGINKVTVQVVAGVMTRIEFNALVGSSNPLSCSSKILEQPWLNVKDIKITCEAIHQVPQTETSPFGGIEEKDPNDPIYTKLAEESWAKYKEEQSLTECTQLIQVVKATEQLVAGTMYRIDFNVWLSTSGYIACNSEIWEQPWLHKKEYKVTCH